MATFSVTDRGTYRRCRRRWDFSSNMRRNLTSVGSGPEPLELGGIIHRALADWIVSYFSNDEEVATQAKNPRALKTLFLIHAAQRQNEIETKFEAQYGRKPNVELLTSLLNVIDLGAAMMENYQRYHDSPLPKNMRFAAPEQEIVVPVPGTEHRCKPCFMWAYERDAVTVVSSSIITIEGNTSVRFNARADCKECKGTGTAYHYLSATLDGLVQDDKDRLFVLEHKTYGDRPQPIDLSMNDQFTGYAWVVRELGIGKVGRIAYDGMWKRAEPPKYMRKEKRAGTLADLFIRKIITKSAEELDAWGQNLALEINEMANNPSIYPNVPWQGCSDCNFQDVCIMMLKGEDPTNLIQMKYTQREVVRGGQAI